MWAGRLLVDFRTACVMVQAFLDESVAASTEGLIVKTLADPYEPSKRSLNWLKLKKDYLEGCGDTFDVTVIGALHGKGKRTGEEPHSTAGLLSQVLLASSCADVLFWRMQGGTALSCWPSMTQRPRSFKPLARSGPGFQRSSSRSCQTSSKTSSFPRHPLTTGARIPHACVGKLQPVMTSHC